VREKDFPIAWKTRKELEDNTRLEALINTRHHFITSIPQWEMITLETDTSLADKYRKGDYPVVLNYAADRLIQECYAKSLAVYKDGSK
jgi:hypothetical protein